ncbi:acylphosphatase [Ponticoccus sp. SC2-23]|uniref:acylphosphatase n=1 Tax=Alexandriicola marinus TaxID=2081710 RepID=UPI000FDBC067|nr:acylphosphatase [Alexandriicola marinus]MBM1221290.1 acylphosphatase [Ponticoccus sp. SC6-9]MBM1225860.1 acylphosphatase [Ponticoccus sp. SC6-15]MBM1228012.1 acylphosphatase [Ponticoccus sp. SC6-38]MBM1234350.1 acylphosphatase [Ponticoccus sp. SC6-45]MBM1238514.1 acylphosphatase [Ponticoccus sp. SC6-49]MBM1243783.1 acylphosphatase [Ponticoccus sp. SC2-64]MBM1247874.1 acylphosphatase [Ponticoccus sp. SC6-42]MBM1252914.1 acylphosphatase [Ponticoccus sp. SC6-33]MBM1256523.1 acylphosphatase
MTAIEFRLEGDLDAASFPDWICHRARLLDLSGWVTNEADGAVSIVVTGPEALIDAMEMACSLGPREVLVDRIERRPHGVPAALNGFHKR